MSANKYVPKDYNPRLTATEEQVNICNEKIINFQKGASFGTDANPDVGDKRKNKWFDQCLKHEQNVSSLAGPEAKKVYEAEQEALTKTAGFGNIPKVAWVVIGVGVLYFVARKQKWIK
jgi:hypothetical protein